VTEEKVEEKKLSPKKKTIVKGSLSNRSVQKSPKTITK
jgi:hypothetical protein